MGAVELCEEEGSGRLLARKTILPELSRSAKARSMFLREARLLAKIAHPNVVAMLEIDPGDDDVAPVLLMEFVDGVSLRDLVAASPDGLPIPIAARIARDVALGLHAAHEVTDDAGRALGVVHRDVSPHNVVVTFDGGVKLLDFGVAKTSEGTRTGTGEVKGKMAYMAPEQAMADPVDRRSDIYALGALLWELLTGKRMHGDGTDLEILRRMAVERPQPVSALRPSVPSALSELVARMTAERPDGRPPTALDVADALAPFAVGADVGTVAGWLERTLPSARRAHAARVSSARDARELTRVGVTPRRGRAFALVAVVAVAVVAAGTIAITRAPTGAPATPPSASVAPAAPSSPIAPPLASVAPDIAEPAKPAVTKTAPRPRPSASAPVAPPPPIASSSPPPVASRRDIPIDHKPFDLEPLTKPDRREVLLGALRARGGCSRACGAPPARPVCASRRKTGAPPRGRRPSACLPPTERSRAVSTRCARARAGAARAPSRGV